MNERGIILFFLQIVIHFRFSRVLTVKRKKMENEQEYFDQAERIVRYLKGTLSEADRQALEQWLTQDARHQALFRRLTEERFLLEALEAYPAGDRQQALERVLKESETIARDRRAQGTFIGNRFIRYAAAIVVVAGAAIGWRAWQQAPLVPEAVAIAEDDLLPGGSKAVLTLANGRQIDLDQVQRGKIARQSDYVIFKTDDGSIAYKPAAEKGTQSLKGQYNTVTTPRGGQYHLQLADGSKVWLNAASSLRFPTEFGTAERIVELTGEAYFEVTEAGNKKTPFRVISGKQAIVVVGTHFNVNGYADEGKITTTLLEGRVKVFRVDEREKKPVPDTREVTLLPGQQASLPIAAGDAELQVETVDTDATVAWKNGNFQFTNMDLPTIMRQVSRWYDVEVEFHGKVPEERFRGKMSREVPVSHLFNVLKTSGVNFKIEGKKILISS